MRLARTRSLALAAAAAVAAIGAMGTPPASAGGGCHQRSSEGAGTTVELSNMCMSPTVLRTDVGSTVTFVNRDALEHNLSSNEFFAQLPKMGDTYRHHFDRTGTFAYACTLHLGMVGTVVVGDGSRGSVTETVEAAPITPIVSSRTRSGVPLGVAAPGAVVIAVVAALAGRRSRPSPGP